jgi:putative PEP-CTERM system TPR-repeat lipoprotein
MPDSAPHRLIRLKPLSLCLLIALSGPAAALVGEGAGKAAGDFYENAIARFGEQDYDGAIIQLKNALQQDAKMLPALVLLGRAQLELGHGEAAATYMKEAIAAGADASLTAVPMARALMLQFKHDSVIKEPAPAGLPPAVRAELEMVRARAALETNNRKALDAALRIVEGIDPQSADLLGMKTMLAMQQGDLAEADRLVAESERLYPKDAATSLSRGSMLHLRGETAGALRAYGRVVELEPNNADARLARIGLMLDLGRDSDADEDFERLAELRPDDPRVTYLKAVKLERAGDKEGARLALARANAVLDALGPNVVNRNSQLLLVSGISAFSLDKLETARTALTQYVLMSPTDYGPRKVLASVLLRQKEYREAIKVLEDTVDNFDEDPTVLVMLGDAYQGAGKNHRAQAVLTRAAELRTNDVVVATKLALSKVRTGKMQQAMSELSAIFTGHDYTPAAGMPLAVMYLQQNRNDEAAEVARKLLQEAPDDLESSNLLGIAEVGRGNYAAARAAFEKVANHAPTNVSAQMNLAKLDLREKQYDAARQRIKSLIAKNPSSATLVLELARLAAAEGNVEEAIRWGREANRLDPESFSIASFLVDAYLAAGKMTEAVDLVTEQNGRHRENLFVLDKLAEVTLRAGDADRARIILKQMSALSQDDGRWLMRIARRHVQMSNANDAAYVLEKAVLLDSDNLEAQSLLAEMNLARGKLMEVEAAATLLTKSLPQSDLGPRLLGAVAGARGDFETAIVQFREAQTRGPDAFANALALHSAMDAAGRSEEALGVLQAYVQGHDEKLEAHVALAEHYLRNKDYASAKVAFAKPLSLRPNDPLLLNNYANVLFELKDPAALDIARRAQAQLPEHPLVNDTLGWLLVNVGKPEEGLRHLRDARTRDSGSLEIQYHLAVALHELGRRDEARAELKSLLGSPGMFQLRPAAEALLQELGS